MSDSSYRAYGRFSADGREFIITRMDTPRPWLNYSWSRHLLIDIDQRGTGSSFYRDDDGNRSVPINRRFLYLRDGATGEYWTVGWGDIRRDGAEYRCRHGLGYSVLECRYRDWECRWSITACANDTEVWRIEVGNRAAAKRELEVYAGVGFELGGWVPYGSLENYAEAEALSPHLIYADNSYDHERSGIRNDAFFGAKRQPDSLQCSKRRFLGDLYRDWGHPQAVIDGGELDGTRAMNEEMVGIMHYRIAAAAGANWSADFVNAPCFDEAEAQKLLTGADFDAAMHAHATDTACFDRVDFELPDPEWSRFFNIWGKQQLLLLKDYARIFLIGFRDTLQDAAAIAAYAPELAADSIRNTLRHQYADGSTLRGWCPLDTHKYGDGGVWIAPALAEYLKETGDFAFLEETVPYFDGGAGTVWEHLKQAFAWFEANLGSHGFPKLYFGDWNDSLNIGRGGKGESVWIALALIVAYDEAAAIARHAGKTADERQFAAAAEAMRTRVEQLAWDGNWYLRGFNDAGDAVGGHRNEAGSIFSEPQSWAVFARMNPERLRLVHRAVAERLRTPTGLTVCDPPFLKFDPAYGRITSMRPGWGENASCYCHVTAFQAVADCMMGDGEAAWASLESIVPFNPALPVETSRLEPYAFSNMFRGPANVRSGETFKGWTSGTVPWAMRAMTHYVLGIRPDYDALTVDPVWPKHWDRVCVRRQCRGFHFDIELANPDALASNEAQWHWELDGKPFTGNRIAFAELPPGRHSIRGILRK